MQMTWFNSYLVAMIYAGMYEGTFVIKNYY